MSERLGFALVLLVAVASVASLLFLSGTNTTGYVTYEAPCGSIRCAGNEKSYPLYDAYGNLLVQDDGSLICICPQR